VPAVVIYESLTGKTRRAAETETGRIAAERREGGIPPVSVASDGTVF